MREIKFRFWTEKEKGMATWEDVKKECDRLSLLEMDGFIPMQYTGLKNKNGKEVYEGDVVKLYIPLRSYQDHYGDNIPGPMGHYREPLEPYIKKRIDKVIFHDGIFMLDGDKGNDFSMPLSYYIHPGHNKDNYSYNFEPEVSGVKWEDPEEGDLAYLLQEYNLENEEALISLLNSFEIIGNIHENPELLED